MSELKVCNKEEQLGYSLAVRENKVLGGSTAHYEDEKLA
jgi:hypothetical protein